MKIAIIGAGSWGTALSVVLAREQQHDIHLWAHEASVCDSISREHINAQYLPGIKVPQSVVATTDLAGALAAAEIVLFVVPSHFARNTVARMLPALDQKMLIVSATKGLEGESFLRMTEVITGTVKDKRDYTPRVGALSGPSFAKEVGRGDPTAITIASVDRELAMTVQKEFSHAAFRLYTNDDVVGVEMGGALKNIIAIAAGICEGLQLGHNTAAALMTRGLAEISRLAVASGARRETMLGLAGMGDLVLTCTGGLSRNRTVGVELGKGRILPEIEAGMNGMVAEGVFTVNAAVGLARKLGVEMPITQQVYAILHDGKPPQDAIRELMTRPGKDE